MERRQIHEIQKRNERVSVEAAQEGKIQRDGKKTKKTRLKNRKN
jgi:hypothetical protein